MRLPVILLLLLLPHLGLSQFIALPNPEESLWRAKMLATTIKELKESIRAVQTLEEGIDIYRDTRDGIRDIQSLKEELISLERLREVKLSNALKVSTLKISEMTDALERAYSIVQYTPASSGGEAMSELLEKSYWNEANPQYLLNLFHQGSSRSSYLWELNEYDFNAENIIQYHTTHQNITDQIMIKAAFAYQKIALEKIAIAQELNEQLNQSQNLEMNQAERITLQTKVQQLLDEAIEFRLKASDLLKKAGELKEIDKAKLKLNTIKSDKERFLEHYKPVKYGDH